MAQRWHVACVAVSRTGFKNWVAFAEKLYGQRVDAMPPTLDGILAWSHTFRCAGTFANYCGHLRTVCTALDVDVPSAENAAIRRAKTAIVK